jgi:hypothetical protein
VEEERNSAGFKDFAYTLWFLSFFDSSLSLPTLACSVCENLLALILNQQPSPGGPWSAGFCSSPALNWIEPDQGFIGWLGSCVRPGQEQKACYFKATDLDSQSSVKSRRNQGWGISAILWVIGIGIAECECSQYHVVVAVTYSSTDLHTQKSNATCMKTTCPFPDHIDMTRALWNRPHATILQRERESLPIISVFLPSPPPNTGVSL